ncbi:MAG TPA: hypothetical protein VND65_04940, partial [Candidatus Binatia bacterium]|nr:hypothetical protein [Candidatus Binatia bacterium]
MNKILVTVVIGAATLAAAGAAAQTAPSQSSPSTPPAQQPAAGAQGQPAAGGSQAPVIKDPAEYNAYVAAIGQKDPSAQISGLEAFLTQYPSSVMKTAALQVLMQDYQQTGNQAKTIDTATKLLAADPANERALFLLAYIDRMKAQGGSPTAQQDLADAKKYGQMGLDNLPKFTKPDGMSDPDFQKMKDSMTGVFNAAIGLGDLTAKDYNAARKDLRAAVDSSPDFQKDFSVVYPLALAYAGPTPPDPNLQPDPVNAIWFSARASVIAPPQAQAQIEKYARSLYVKCHGGDDGWTDVLSAAKAGPGPIPTMKPAPSPDEQAHNMVGANAPDKMDFATWEFVLSNGKQEDQDAVWNVIKGKPVQMNGTVIK